MYDSCQSSMIHVAPSMIANSSYCLFHDDKEWAELADINGFFFFQRLELKLCHFVYPG